MAQECEAHVHVAPDAIQPIVGVRGCFLDRVGAQIGQLAAFRFAHMSSMGLRS